MVPTVAPTPIPALAPVLIGLPVGRMTPSEWELRRCLTP